MSPFLGAGAFSARPPPRLQLSRMCRSEATFNTFSERSLERPKRTICESDPALRTFGEREIQEVIFRPVTTVTIGFHWLALSRYVASDKIFGLVMFDFTTTSRIQRVRLTTVRAA